MIELGTEVYYIKVTPISSTLSTSALPTRKLVGKGTVVQIMELSQLTDPTSFSKKITYAIKDVSEGPYINIEEGDVFLDGQDALNHL